jgi:hypothetical protein
VSTRAGANLLFGDGPKKIVLLIAGFTFVIDTLTEMDSIPFTSTACDWKRAPGPTTV